MRDLPWRNLWSSDNPVEVLNEHLSLMVERYVPARIIGVRNQDISLGSMINADVLSTSRKRLICGPVTALGLTGKNLLAVKSELMKHTQRPSISLVSETLMF